MIKRIFLLVCVFLIIAFSLSYLLFQRFHNPSKYPDEPKIESKQLHVISVSSWSKPKKPQNISVASLTLDKNLLNDMWSTSSGFMSQSDLKKQLDKLHVSQNYYNWFYLRGIYPLEVEYVQVTGAGPSMLTYGNGVGCDSCHDVYITVFVGMSGYTVVTQGFLYPRSDHNGFYITDRIYNQTTPLSNPPDAVEIERYQWNGNGFTEMGTKTVRVIGKNT